MSASGGMRIPAPVKRNTLLLAATQAFVGGGTQMVPTLGGIMIERLLGSIALAGLASSALYFARLLIAYPIGWLMDVHGRKAGLLFGLGLNLMGALALGAAMVSLSLPLFVFGVLVFGMGVGVGQQLRTAAADMYLPDRRGEGLGYVLTGSLIGALGGPLIIFAADRASPRWGTDPVALAWFLVPALVIPSMALVLLIRPDPKAIGMRLSVYYPGYEPPAADERVLAAGVGMRSWLGHAPIRVALAAMFAAHGIMVMMMALTPLAMSHSGHALPLISLAVALHVVGMYGPSLPAGRLADRIGRRPVIVLGLITVALGSLLVPLAADFWVATAGLVAIGVGWSGVNVATTALVADAVPPGERGRAIGVVDVAAGLASIALPLAGGPLAEAYGFIALAILACAVVAGPILLTVRLREPRGRASITVPAEAPAGAD